MEVVVKRIRKPDVPDVESRINKFLKDPANAAFALAAAFEASNGDIVLIFQKP